MRLTVLTATPWPRKPTPLNCGMLLTWTTSWRVNPGVEALLMLCPVVTNPACAAFIPLMPMPKMLFPI